MIRTVSPQNAQLHLDELLDAVREENDTIVVESDGQIVAAVIGGDEYEQYRQFVRQRAWRALDPLRECNADQDPDDVFEFVTEIVHDVRRERREQRRSAD